ncbi:hypothetical protein HMPREF3156_01085, partial [Neisseria sp. HMSC06F02]
DRCRGLLLCIVYRAGNHGLCELLKVLMENLLKWLLKIFAKIVC